MRAASVAQADTHFHEQRAVKQVPMDGTCSSLLHYYCVVVQTIPVSVCAIKCYQMLTRAALKSKASPLSAKPMPRNACRLVLGSSTRNT